MFFKWFPWRGIVRWAMRRYGLIDPAGVLARFRRFAEPSEVAEPLEIVRAWMIFHSRGVVNTRAIQHNLDWVWPFWVEKQFNPRDPSFIPRAHSISHINMTHRNWTAVGLPGVPLFPLVDPRGLVTPMYDGWSLDAWVIDKDGNRLVPSRSEDVSQHIETEGDHVIHTRIRRDSMRLNSEVRMGLDDRDQPRLEVRWRAEASGGGQLAVAIRPYNPEGIQFVDTIESGESGKALTVNDEDVVNFEHKPDRVVMSQYAEDDVFNRLDAPPSDEVECDVGMATAAALFDLGEHEALTVDVAVPLHLAWDKVSSKDSLPSSPEATQLTWRDAENACPSCELPDTKIQRQFELSVRTLMLLSPMEIYPGPYTYRRFWYRDASLMLKALLVINQMQTCRRIIEKVFPQRQRRDGYYESQEGEWDSNGQVLWSASQYVQCSGEKLSEAALDSLERGARWIDPKRHDKKGEALHRGLLPAGFSAEHLGPNNHYYWDNYWAVGGLRDAAPVFEQADRKELAASCRRWADDLFNSIEQSVKRVAKLRGYDSIPAAPNRRMDAGAIGSIAAAYPLCIYEPGDHRIAATIEFLLERCMVRGAFFQDMTHSGMNAYLTLQMAQVLLRQGDERYEALLDRVIELASCTGQWPEASHPLTDTGCMGDGQHGWAAAEMVLMIAALFVREESNMLVIGSGLKPSWIDSDRRVVFGPTATSYGPVTVTLDGPRDNRKLIVEGKWPDDIAVEARLRGCERLNITQSGEAYEIQKHSKETVS